MSIPNFYSLGHTPGRRAGLTRAGYRGPQLLQTINSPGETKLRKMPAKKTLGSVKLEAERVNQELADSINALPKSDESDSDSSEAPSIDIRRSNLRASEEPKPQPLRSRAAPKRTVNEGNVSGTRSANSISTRSRISPSSSFTSSSESTKRKSPERSLSQFGAGMLDEYGRTKIKKPKSAVYGSSQNRYGSSQASKTYGKANKESSDKDSPKRIPFIVPTAMAESDDDSDVELKFKSVDIRKSPVKLNLESPVRKFIVARPNESPSKEEEEKIPTFNKPILEYSDVESPNQTPIRAFAFKSPHTLPETASEPPATQLAPFRRIDLDDLGDDDLIGAAREVISIRGTIPRAAQTYEDDFPTMTQLARCPMCYQPVDSDALRAFGTMNMRQQAKFCHSHQKKDAMETWELEEYPEIQWENLDSRIAQHYAFIKELVDGKDSHYRAILEETVKSGKDRNLLKSNSNLTPGYYGSRGLTEISESIMRRFTKQLKDRAPADPIMSARGFAGFVQSVLVPEVTVKLIMEDMSVDIERARKILIESVGVGELIHEEIKDVVTRTVDDSEDDDEYDD